MLSLTFASGFDNGAFDQEDQLRLGTAVLGFTLNVFCRGQSFLKSGTDQSTPIGRKNLATEPVVCLIGNPNTALMPEQAWIVASQKTIS
ncbi:hypothetical protein N6L27_15550 [Leisingera sp. SS27]|nr:hypothetical protein [Leisingera sp. SS27]MDC0659415.1 hypothetical protein [Leisingera sp. SS27]